ncbi:MAG: hypothetical protein LBU45_06380 [Azoarcus sp.]|nr:hypothetical protein [Azoarcus sp.]
MLPLNLISSTLAVHSIMRKTACLVCMAMLPFLSACDRLVDLLDIPDPAREAIEAQAEGEAIGSACRQTGRSIEDCYALNPTAQKAAIFTGWKSMNDYMSEHDLKEVPSLISRNAPPAAPANPAASASNPKPPQTAAAH